MYELTSYTKPYQNHIKPYQTILNHTISKRLYLQLSITAISIHNATLLSCHFRKIATVSHFWLVYLSCTLTLKVTFPILKMDSCSSRAKLSLCSWYQRLRTSSLSSAFITSAMRLVCLELHGASSLQITLPLSVMWVTIMSRNDKLKLKVWWLLMTFDDFWQLLMTFDDFWWL